MTSKVEEPCERFTPPAGAGRSDPKRWPRAGKLAACCALIGWLTLAQYEIFDRLLFQQPVNFGFVLANVQGVLEGRPISKSWQQRFLAPTCVAALDVVTGNRFASFELFFLG